MSYKNLVDEIQKIINLPLPCEAETEVEILCDDCPWDIIPGAGCALTFIQDRAKRMEKEMKKNE